MDRNGLGFRTWGRRLGGVLVGLAVVTPALAMPPDLPIAFDDGVRLYVLIGSGVLLFAALVMRLLRGRDKAEVSLEVPRGYGMRFFPSDRPIALE